MDQRASNWDDCLQHAALSDVGLRRANNQDAMAVVLADSGQTWQQRGHLFVVADGMGAHAAGELASKLAVDTVALTYSKLLELPPPQALRAAVEDANRLIHQRGQADPEFRGMGTTATALVLLPQGALAANVGDSRTYRLRGDRFEQLTFDHSLVWEMRAAGDMLDSEITDYVPKNIITRSLGPNPTVDVDIEGPFPIAVGDTFLLCSDGLSGPVEDKEIGTIIGSMPPSESARALVDLAILRGGPDNVTVIVARVTGPRLAAGGDATRSAATSGRPSAQPVHPLIWTLLGVTALAAGGAVAMQSWLAAAVCMVGALAAGLIAIVQRYGSAEADSEFGPQPLGKGPHASFTCAADDEFVDRLNQIVEELREAATDGDWAVDWPRFDELLKQAADAKESNKPTEAVRSYCHLISFMMAQLKHQRDSDGG